MGSREAAARLHSPTVLDENFGIEGLEATEATTLLQRLKTEGIGADLGGELEAAVAIELHSLQGQE